MDKQNATIAIAQLLERASDALDEAVRISEASGVEFHLPWGGEGTHQRGMGASYYPEGHPSIESNNGYYDDVHEGWNPSAGTC